MNPPAAQPNPRPEGWNLRWRRSPNAPQPTQPSADVFSSPNASTNIKATPISTRAETSAPQFHGQLHVATEQPNLRPVSRAGWSSNVGSVAPAESPSEIRLTQAQSDDHDFFSDPFGDDQPAITGQSIPVTSPQGEMLLPPPGERAADPVLPSESAPMNELRNAFDQLDDAASSPQGNLRGVESMPTPSQQQALPSPTPQAPQNAAPKQNEGPSLGEMLRDSNPTEGLQPPATNDSFLPPPSNPQTERETPAPDARDQRQFDNPFERLRNEEADKADRDRLNSGRPEDIDRPAREDGVGRYDNDLDDLKTPAGLSCTDFRKRIAEQTIEQVSLDISPPYRPDEIDSARYEKLKEEFDEKQSIRQWRSVDGRELASGRLRDLAYEKAIIETESGSLEELAVSRLSEADLAYIAENWGLPKECLLEQLAYTPRSWTPITMTWKASNLCHSPLYFEDVNLERYGHTHGPICEPIVQSAHFFANIAVLPYKMGVHSPKECQYALGYYRPGSCAPWIVPPVPISARGALTQGAVMTGLFWLIP